MRERVPVAAWATGTLPRRSVRPPLTERMGNKAELRTRFASPNVQRVVWAN